MPAAATKRTPTPPRAAPVAPPPKLIRDKQFAQRFVQACEQHPHCPDKHRGRLDWIRLEMEKLGETVSNETIRKWSAGEAKPRPDKGARLAQVLEVDVAWLQMGYDPQATPKEQRARNSQADGAVNLIAGLIQMDGGHPAFPADDDKRAKRDHVDLYAIIRGANYALHIVLGETEGRQAKFAVPAAHENVTVLGIVRDGFAVDVFELTPEAIEKHGHRRGATIEVVVDGSKLNPIKSFSQRF